MSYIIEIIGNPRRCGKRPWAKIKHPLSVTGDIHNKINERELIYLHAEITAIAMNVFFDKPIKHNS